jgi:hypothetical protein
VGNERVRCRSGISTGLLEPGACHAVTFVVFLRYPLGFMRVRMTSDLLRVPPAA